MMYVSSLYFFGFWGCLGYFFLFVLGFFCLGFFVLVFLFVLQEELKNIFDNE